MLDGAAGPAKQRAMNLLLRYGEALGAERLVSVTNVAGTWSTGAQAMRPHSIKGLDALFSKFNLDADDVVDMPQVEVSTCQLIHGVDTRNFKVMGVTTEAAERQQRAERYFGARGVQMFNTCTPYQVGNVPVRGEHCAWMESSAVAYCNAVLGARTNTEGRESASAASITGRIPDWGLHRAENRRGTHRISVRVNVDSMLDWGLLGYYVGEIVGDGIPVLDGIRHPPNMMKLKHFGAAASSSGSIEMYHVPGVTPEAESVYEAFGGGPPEETFAYGPDERREAAEWLNSSAEDTSVDFITLGCPHASVEEVWTIARLLDGKRIHSNVRLWVFMPRALTDTAELNGHAEIIRKAGGHVLSDTCPAIGRVLPEGTKVVATDSARQAHYLPSIMDVEVWFGSLDDCIDAALTGRWRGQIF